MMTARPLRLLSEDDPAPVTHRRMAGLSPFFLTCEHAGCAIPRRLNNLGVSDSERARHIGWDIGALAVAERVSDLLDAPLISQTYSRLVIDCNRATHHADSIPTVSEYTRISGNLNLPPYEVAARTNEIYHPFHDAIAKSLDTRRDAGLANILVAVHSFTPVFKGVKRPWHMGLLFNRDWRLASVLSSLIGNDRSVVLGINQPYAISDATDYTIPFHGEKRGILHVEIEIRQDLIAELAGQKTWAGRLAAWLSRSLEMSPVMRWAKEPRRDDALADLRGLGA